MVLSSEARAYQRLVRVLAKARSGGMEILRGDVCVDLIWHRARRAGDLDKRVGILLDALQGVAYVKDAQIRELHAKRSDRRTAPGRIFVTITPLTPEE